MRTCTRQNFTNQTICSGYFAVMLKTLTLWNLSLLLFTWMSSSLLSNSDTTTFSPSASRVRDTQSFPEARMWASAGSLSSRESCTARSRLKDGWKTPRVCLLASLAMFKTSTQNCSKEERVTKSVFGAAVIIDIFSCCVYSCFPFLCIEETKVATLAGLLSFFCKVHSGYCMKLQLFVSDNCFYLTMFSLLFVVVQFFVDLCCESFYNFLHCQPEKYLTLFFVFVVTVTLPCVFVSK